MRAAKKYHIQNGSPPDIDYTYKWTRNLDETI